MLQYSTCLHRINNNGFIISLFYSDIMRCRRRKQGNVADVYPQFGGGGMVEWLER